MSAPLVDLSTSDLARAARLLTLRCRRQAAGLFAGGYASAFRGEGMEFHESRPYAPGDDVRRLDWNAFARSGEAFVKLFREERDVTLLLALDVSGSMAFGSAGRSVAAAAVHAAALLAAAAGLAGDRVGFLGFDARVRSVVPPGRGAAHVWRVIRAAAAEARRAGGETRVGAAVEGLRASSRHRTVSVLISDFRDPAIETGEASELAALARGHDVVAVGLTDPRDAALVPSGLVRIGDPERAGRAWLLPTRSARLRTRYRRAGAARRRALEHRLRGAGCDVLWLRTDRDPLRALLRFFQRRAARPRLAPERGATG